MKKGFSMVTLIVSIMVSLILITTVSLSGIAIYNDGVKMAFATELNLITTSVQNYYEMTGKYPIKDNIEIDISNVSDEAKIQFDSVDSTGENIILLDLIDFELLGISTLSYGNKEKSVNDVYAISVNTGKVYYVQGVNIGSDSYYTLTEDLKEAIDFNLSVSDAFTNDGILFKPSEVGYTKLMSMTIFVPKSITSNTNTISVKYNGVNSATLTNNANSEYYEYYIQYIYINGIIEVSYSYLGENKVTEYVVSNIDMMSPTLDIENNQHPMITEDDKFAYSRIEYSDDISGVKIAKYTNTRIPGSDIYEYFQTQGVVLHEKILPIEPGVTDITVYLEDNAGNWIAKYVDVEDNLFGEPATLVDSTNLNSTLGERKEEIKKIVFSNKISDNYAKSPIKFPNLSIDSGKEIVGWIDNNDILYIESNYNIVATYTASLFNGFIALEEIVFDNFNTNGATSMSNMFYNCRSLKTLDLSIFNTESVTSMYGMFGLCTSLETVELSSFNTKNVVSMSHMFSTCMSLTTLDLTNFSAPLVRDTYRMFYDCNNLQKIEFGKFSNSSNMNMANMFGDCRNLTQLDLTSFTFASGSVITDMFMQTGSLTVYVSTQEALDKLNTLSYKPTISIKY